jgi:hypothetical protein
MFFRNQSKYGNAECIFRISQDGILNLIPYMTKRIVYTDNEETFKFFIRKKSNDVNFNLRF